MFISWMTFSQCHLVADKISKRSVVVHKQSNYLSTLLIDLWLDEPGLMLLTLVHLRYCLAWPTLECLKH